MSRYLLIYLISFLSVSVKLGTAAFTDRNFVYQKDMSEYCRRRVVPAVFLSQQVVDANSQILLFSRLEVPYNCFITVRTEMGSNIIVVIQVVTDSDTVKSCKQGDHQLLIHELGETFGGYWGQMPDSVLQQVKGRDDRTYTLKSSVTAPPSTTTTRTTTISTTTSPTTSNTADEDESAEEDPQEYLTVELPILNVSAKIVPGQIELGTSFPTEDNFDFVYDVTPRAGESYDTKVVPLLEIGVKKVQAGRRYDDKTNGSIAEFQMELNDMFTPDPRLLPLDIAERTYKRKLYKYRPNANRLDFKKNKNHFIPKGALYKKRPSFTDRRPLNTVQQNDYVSKLYDVKHKLIQPLHISKKSNYEESGNVESKSEESKTEQKPHYWDAIHDILKNLSQNSDVTTEPPHKELANILRGISNRKFNKSVYLSPEISYMDLNTPGVPVIEYSSTITREKPATYRTHSYQLNDVSKNTSVPQDSNRSVTKTNAGMNNNSAINYDDGSTLVLLPLALDVDSIILNVTNQNKDDKQSKAVLETHSTMNVEKLDTLAVSLVDHESFENVVQSASAMAIMLNQTKATSGYKTKREVFVTKPRRRKIRKKRYLHAIDIEGAQPHYEQRMKHVSTTSASENFNMREFQSLVELQDDEIQDRVAMRYLPQLMGPPLLDFCDFNETSTRYVYLFNSSRIVLALSNFTMRRMTVVVTPAQTLLSGEASCGPTHIECQVSGARVCIDSFCACDGVPNCGSYDIYDEDRLSCGSAPGYRHNVCLAAITFLAVMLTILYTIHYWLTRYIPKVSEAFFIYTDAAENVLYLDTIMKSPHDIGVEKDFLRGTQELFDYGVKENPCKRFMNRCLKFLRCKKSLEETVPADFDYAESPFAEIELNKMTSFLRFAADAAVQTDLEESFFPICSKDENFSSENLLTTSIGPAESDSTQPSDELNMLQFLRKVRARSISLQQDYRNNHDFGELPDKSQLSLLKSSSYEKGMHSSEKKEKAEVQITIEKPEVSKKIHKPVVKQLRFQDEAIVIPNTDDELDDDVVASTRLNKRRSIVFGAGKVVHIQETDGEPNETEEQTGTGRELKSYFNWGSGKEKKKKKPKKK